MNTEALSHASLTTIGEAALVARLLREPLRRSDILGIHGLPDDPVIRESVALHGLPGAPRGDVDILLWRAGQPDQAAAIEVKRIKAEVDKDSFRLNKLHEFEKGVQQANRLADLGFWQVYLFVFVMVDSRRQNAGKAVSYDGMTPEQDAIVGNAISTRGLRPRIGLMHCEFVQSMDAPPLSTGTYGGHLVRMATKADQPSSVTNWIETLAQPT